MIEHELDIRTADAARFPERVKCAASMYGVRLATDHEQSPHLQAHKVRGELYFGCAETDKYAPREMIDKLEAHLKTIPGLRFRVEWYNGRGTRLRVSAARGYLPQAERGAALGAALRSVQAQSGVNLAVS
jgi:dienelactone hydrolase